LPHFDRFAHEEEHLSSLEGFDFEALIKRSESEEKRPRSKAEIIELLRTEGERWAQWVEQLPESLLSEQVRMGGGVSKNRFEMLIRNQEHEMQHRAQLTVIERLLGIVPHLTRNRRLRGQHRRSVPPREVFSQLLSTESTGHMQTAEIEASMRLHYVIAGKGERSIVLLSQP